MRCGRLATIVLWAATTAGAALAGAAQPEIATGPDAGASGPPAVGRRPEASRRVVASFDFEERLTNPEPIPLGWRVDQDRDGRERPGFPVYNQPALDYSVSATGEGSVRLPTRGGSTSLVVDTGVIPVFPEADYRITAMVRTEGLTHARAFVEASMLDATGGVIEGSRRRSRAILGSAWTEAEVSLRGDWASAAFVRIELLVLQASEYESEPPGYGRVWATDVSGSAWFDDVRVVQQPRVTISTGTPGSVVTRPSAPVLEILARDTAGERLEADFAVYDVGGRLVASGHREIAGGRWQGRWDPGLTALGWYRCVVQIKAEGRRIGWGALDFAWLDARARTSEGAGGLGMEMSACPVGLMPEVVEASEAAGAERLVLPVWSAGLGEGEIGALEEGLGRAMERGAGLRGRVGFALPRLPDALAEVLGLRGEQVLRALSSDPVAWAGFLDPLLDHFGQSVVAWQVGAVGDESAMASAGLAEEVGRVRAALARLVPGPRVVVPWRGDRAPAALAEGSMPGAGFSVLIPASVSPEGVGGVVSGWSGSGADSAGSAGGAGAEVGFVFEPFDVGLFGARASVIDLVKRAVFAWAGSGDRDPSLWLLDPWTGGGDAREPLMPRPEVGVWRTLRDHLRGRRVVGELDVGEGMRCLILAARDGGTEGALVAWNEWGGGGGTGGAGGADATPGGDEAAIDLMLNLGGVRVVDPFGNERVVAPLEEIRGGLVARHHHIPLTDMPVFIEGIDVPLALLQSSFRIEPGLLEARGTPRDLELVLTNPWTTTMSGRAFIVEPGGATEEGARDRSWRIEPRTFDFEAAAGQEARMPLSVQMREFEEAGPKRWVLDLRLAGREDLGWITVSAPVEVGLEGVDLRVSARVVGADVSVEVTIANTRDTALLLDATVFAPGFGRERRTLGEVLARTQVTRRFFYEGGAARLRGQSVVASVRETETGARLNVGAVVP